MESVARRLRSRRTHRTSGRSDFLIGEWTEDVDKGGSAKASYSWTRTRTSF